MPCCRFQDKFMKPDLNFNFSDLNKYLKLFNVDFVAFGILSSYSNDAIKKAEKETEEKIITKIDNTFNINNLIKNKGEEKAFAIILIKQLMFDFFKKKILDDAKENIKLADILDRLKYDNETEYLKLIENLIFNEINVFFKSYMGEKIEQ